MADKADIAAAAAVHERKALGFSTSRMQTTPTADIDALVKNLKIGPGKARHRTGLYYGPDGGAIGTQLLTNQVMNVGPLVWEEYAVIEEIGIDVTTAGTEGSLYTALYADRGDGYPGELIHASAALGVTAGFKSTTGLEIELPPGLYWAGVALNGVVTTAATVRSLTGNSRFVGETAGANDVSLAGYSQAAVTGAPPATFTDTVTPAAFAPRVMMKVKS